MTEMIDRSSHFSGEQRLYMIVARRIARMIDEHVDDPEWRVPTERELAELLAVSRPVIREATIALEVRGIVEVKGRSGISVVPRPDEKSALGVLTFDPGAGIEDLIDARLAIETNIARFAAGRASAYDIALLEKCMSKACSSTLELPDLMELDREFHSNLAQMTGNVLLKSLVKQVRAEWDKSAILLVSLKSIDPSTLQSLWIGDHQAVLSAIRMRQQEAAFKAMARYFRNLRMEFREADPDIVQA